MYYSTATCESVKKWCSKAKCEIESLIFSENVTSMSKGRLLKHFIKHRSSWDYHIAIQLRTKTRKFCGFVIQELQMIFKCNSAIFLTSSKCNLHVRTIWTHIIICRFLNYHVVHIRRQLSEQFCRQLDPKNEKRFLNHSMFLPSWDFERFLLSKIIFLC